MASGKNESNKGLSRARPIEGHASGGHNNIGVALVFYFLYIFGCFCEEGKSHVAVQYLRRQQGERKYAGISRQHVAQLVPEWLLFTDFSFNSSAQRMGRHEMDIFLLLLLLNFNISFEAFASSLVLLAALLLGNLIAKEVAWLR